jgi:hypothetical protein
VILRIVGAGDIALAADQAVIDIAIVLHASILLGCERAIVEITILIHMDIPMDLRTEYAIEAP